MSLPSNMMLPPVGVSSRVISRPVVDLPQPGLSDEPQRTTLDHLERDPVHGLHIADGAVDEALAT